MDKIILKIFHTIMVVSVVLMVTAFAVNHNGTSGENIVGLTPSSETENIDGVRSYNFDLQDIQLENQELAFLTSHQLVHVLADQKEIYALDKTGGIWGHTTGNVWNFLEIPEDTRELTVQIQSCYPSLAWYEVSFYMGCAMDVFHWIFERSIGAAVASSMVIFLGMIMVLYWLVVHKKAGIGNAMLYLGVFAMILGLWFLNETNIFTVVVSDRIAAGFMAFVLLMLMSVPFILFARSFFELKDTVFWKLLCVCSSAEIVLRIILQMLDIADLKETLLLSHIVLVLAHVYVIGCIIYKIRRKEVDGPVKAMVKGMFLIITATGTDMAMYYLHMSITDLFGGFAFLLFIALLGYEAAKTSMTMINNGILATKFEEMATRDTLTGLFSRNAYEKDIEEENPSSIVVITFDLNNLKACNDIYGHKKGDSYIVKAAASIATVFGDVGKCYRIGGDEFCCLSQKNTIQYLPEKIQLLHEKMEESREQLQMPEAYVACGYAEYKFGSDRDLEDTRNRADAMMYRNKKESKLSM
ncbi:MAG: diguanylate cyclase [Lachnospiraceae bacterium]|nr:diguanylate cyclase [Lachnospiraceae bacterium]